MYYLLIVLQGRFAPADEAMACIFVWLRYSAIRQITWQRNYNTQPRILGAAQERLTHCLADACGKLQGPAKEWARLCLPAIGRGGNAQAVRDEILNIMHRNKISEVKGTWMEEFHQKLHNKYVHYIFYQLNIYLHGYINILVLITPFSFFIPCFSAAPRLMTSPSVRPTWPFCNLMATWVPTGGPSQMQASPVPGLNPLTAPLSPIPSFGLKRKEL